MISTKIYSFPALIFGVLMMLGIPMLSQPAQAQEWLQYTSMSDAGFSQSGIDDVKLRYDSTNAAAMMVIYKGKVLVAYGDNTRRFMVHSIRKSFLSALYGIYQAQGIIDLDRNLASLRIDDIQPLSDAEKTAKISDLLTARSGIYLPAAYSPRGMEDNLPERGSHLPGTYWYYNNWDFNALCTIFEQLTERGIFESFQEKIGTPLGMEDFRISDGFYRYEKDKSDHPAYLFKMSARDLARFGLLYLNRGEWQGSQILSEEWVEGSTSIITSEMGSFSNRGGYGYLWWVSDNYFGHKVFYASGSGGHRIMVLPEAEIVIVIRANTYEGKNVSQEEVNKLVMALINAKTGKGHPDPAVIPYTPERNNPKSFEEFDPSTMDKYLGSYKHPFLGIFAIKCDENGPVLSTSVGHFKLVALGQDRFYPEDLGTIMEFVPAKEESLKLTIAPVFDDQRELVKAVFYY